MNSKPQHDWPAIAAAAGGLTLLVLGAGLGAVQQIRVDTRSIHIAMASLFILLTPVVAYVHAKRFFRKGWHDWIAWSHFVTFAIFLFVVVRMLLRWGSPPSSMTPSGAADDRLLARFRGRTYDLTPFARRHPGGLRNIQKAANGDLEEVWAREKVGWHATDPHVLQELSALAVGE